MARLRRSNTEASATVAQPWPVEEQPDGTVTPVDPVDMASAPVAGDRHGNSHIGDAAPQASEAQPVTDAAVKAAYVEHFGSEEGWLSYKGSWFIEGYRAGRN
ncbi:hypothetical protein HMPREF0004_5720, partial [Achromobacter piechaudii ATCC 43553]